MDIKLNDNLLYESNVNDEVNVKIWDATIPLKFTDKTNSLQATLGINFLKINKIAPKK